MALYASILYSPALKNRWIRPFERKPKLNTRQPTWYTENWVVSRTLGESQSKPSRTTRAGPGWGGLAYYDVRKVAEKDVSEIAEIDLMIAGLQKRRVALIEERFRTWQQVVPDDCEKILPGKTEAAVKAEIKKMRPATESTAQSERRMVATFNQAFDEAKGEA